MWNSIPTNLRSVLQLTTVTHHYHPSLTSFPFNSLFFTCNQFLFHTPSTLLLPSPILWYSTLTSQLSTSTYNKHLGIHHPKMHQYPLELCWLYEAFCLLLTLLNAFVPLPHLYNITTFESSPRCQQYRKLCNELDDADFCRSGRDCRQKHDSIHRLNTSTSDNTECQ